MCGVDLTRAALGQPVRSTMREPGVNFSGLKFLSRYRHREHIYDLRLRETGKSFSANNSQYQPLCSYSSVGKAKLDI